MNNQPVAVKFVRGNVQPLENFAKSWVYLIREQLNRGERLTREQKNWLAERLNHNSYFRTAIPLGGYRFDFSDITRKFLVKQYGSWYEYAAPDKTSLRSILHGRVTQIVEIN